jgi:hypothetical protein
VWGDAVCGAVGEVYRITDFLLPRNDTRSRCQVLLVGMGVISNCSWPLFPATPVCGYIPSRIEIYFQRTDPNTTFVSDITTFLTNLGLQNAVGIGQLLIVQNSINVPKFTPSIFPKLLSVDTNLFLGSSRPISSPLAITSLPFTSIRQIGGDLTVDFTLLTSMTSFSNLTCVGGRILVANNPGLTTLEGLGRVSNVAYTAPSLFFNSIYVVNNALQGRPGISRLALMARCGASSSPIPSPPWIEVATCSNALTSWNSLCTYLQTAICP